MKVVVQLVRRASVSIDEQIVSSIGKGYLLLVGLTPGDDIRIAQKMADKFVQTTEWAHMPSGVTREGFIEAMKSLNAKGRRFKAGK